MAGVRQENLTGLITDRWIVGDYIGKSKYLCTCIKCGNQREVANYSLKKNGGPQCINCSNTSNKGRIDLTGKTFGEWTVIKYAGNKKWTCRCSCGKQRDVDGADLRSGKSTSCGHNTNNKFIDLTGQRFGDWLVLKKGSTGSNGETNWLCRCSCGIEKEVTSYALRSGKSKSCGHNSTKEIDLTGKQFGLWKVLHKAEIQRSNHGVMWTCQCQCANKTIKDLDSYVLRNGISKSCGCTTDEIRKESIQNKYGVNFASQIHSNYTEEQLKLSESKEELLKVIKEFKDKPSIPELAIRCRFNRGSMYGILARHKLLDSVNVGHGPVSGYEDQINELFPCSNRSNKSILGDRDEIDLYYPEYNLGIEFNGTYWHCSLQKKYDYHINKTKKAAKNGIHLIHIFEYEWLDTDTQEKLIGLLSRKLKADEQIRIGARECEMKQIHNKDAKDILNRYHLQGYAPASITYGMYFESNLIGVMSFGKPRFNAKEQYELIRLVWNPKYIVSGGSERLLARFIKDYDPMSIISYCDMSKFSGQSYIKLGFKPKELSRPNYKWVEPETNNILSRYQTMKSKLVKDGLGVEEQTEDEIMESLGYLKIYDCGNMVFIWNKSIES